MMHRFDNSRRRFLGAAAIGLTGAGLGLYLTDTRLVQPTKARSGEELDSLSGASGWLNSSPLTGPALRGKAVLVQFCTYSCINWLRTMPYLRAWVDRYTPHGLVVIGVHTPEFPFEHNLDNVRGALKDLAVTYPVAIDNEFAIWRAFANHWWPALYLIDGRGRIRYRHRGEGEYRESERAIQDLLKEQSGAGTVPSDLVSVVGQGVEAEADWGNLRTAEAYIGRARGEGFARMTGDWSVGQSSARLGEPPGRLECRFHARDLHLVMGSATGTSIPFRVLLHGQAPAEHRGEDVDARGNGVLAGPRMYQLIRQRGRIDDRQFTIEFLSGGAEAFSFTFG